MGLPLNPRRLCPFTDVASSKPASERPSFMSLHVSIFVSQGLDLLVLYRKPMSLEDLRVLLMSWDSGLSLFRVSPRRDHGSQPAIASDSQPPSLGAAETGTHVETRAAG